MQTRNSTFSHILQFVNHYLGWRNWSVLVYNSVLENVFLIFYIALRNEFFSLSFVVSFFAFFLFSMFSTTYGYLINDLADKNLDLRHGKQNTFEKDSRTKASLIVFLFLSLSVVFGLYFVKNVYFLLLWVFWAFLTTFYSVKPIRLKERGKIGLVFVVLAQRVLPTFIIFTAFKYYNWVDVIVFATYILLRGLSSDLNHQLEDYERDKHTDTDTYAVQSGFHNARKVFYFSLEAEKILLILCLGTMYLRLPQYKVYGVSLLFPVLIVYLILCGLTWRQMASSPEGFDVNPFIPGRKDIFQFIHHTFPSVLLPFYLLLLLVYESWIFIIILIFLIIYRKIYSIELIKSSFIFERIRYLIIKFQN